MAPITHLTALVLAGGRGLRMGRPKFDLPLAGERLVDRAVRLVSAHFGDVLVSRGAGPAIPGLEVRQVPDQERSYGPLAGLQAGLRAVQTEGVVTLPIDMPLIDPAFLRLLADELGDADALVTRSRSGLQPLLAAYRRTCLPAIEDTMAQGVRQVLRFHAHVDKRELVVEQRDGWRDRDEMFLNLNTPADLKQAARALEAVR